jgi:hypothetical protein
MDSVHGSWTSAGVAGPQVHHGLPPWSMARLAGARPSGRSGPWWLAARVEIGRARRGAIGGLLTGARMTARRRHTDGGALVSTGQGAGAIEEGRRRGEGVRCSTGVWGSFYRVGREAGAAGNRERRR